MAEHALKGKSVAKSSGTRELSFAEARTRAILFAELTGTNALFEHLGDSQALMHVTRCLALLEEQADEHRGRVVKTIGEQVLCLFPDLNLGANAAIAMQQRIENYAADVNLSLDLKIGLHSGSMIDEGADVFGDAVNVAARLVKLAHAGQILSDAGSIGMMRAALRRRARVIDRRAVRGKSAELEIMELSWRRRAGAPFTTEQGTLLEAHAKASIVLVVEGKTFTVQSGAGAYTIGRDAGNSLRVVSSKASRQHARIEWRRDKFVLFDHSTNGTYVTLDGEHEVMVKHESFLLRGRGSFCLGQSATAARGHGIIGFRCR
jgi:class 3 adenylate cyclase